MSKKRRKRRQVPKKIRAWYRLYRTLQEAREAYVLPIKTWATLEAEKYEGTPRGKVLRRWLGVQPDQKPFLQRDL